jgi:hypothetical protein
MYYLFEHANGRASFFLAGNFLGDIMDCSLSDSAPLAVTAAEIFESIVRGGLAAPNDVHFRSITSLTIGISYSCST